MINNKYKLIHETSDGVGLTNFNRSNGNLIHISGSLVLLVESGVAIVSIGFKKRLLRKGNIAILFYDDAFRVLRHSSTFSARFVSFSYDNVQEAIYKITSPNFWEALSENPIFETSIAQWMLIDGWWQQAEWICLNGTEAEKNLFLKNHIHNLLLAIYCEMEKNGQFKKCNRNRSWTLVLKFLELLSLHCKEVREASFYANKLCITTTYLNKITHQHLNISPKTLISEQVICEIKTYLSNTDLSVKSIALEMNFEDIPYMCRFFRRYTGLSPMEYRNGIGKP